jgi:hypothetical protein
MTVGRKDIEESIDELPDAKGTIHGFEVVDHQDEIRVEVEHLVHQVAHGRSGLMEQISTAGSENVTRPPTKTGKSLPDSADQVSDEETQVAISLIDGVPANRNGGVSGEINEGGRLTITGRGGDERQLALKTLLDSTAEPRPVEKAGRGWHLQLGSDESRAQIAQCANATFDHPGSCCRKALL